MSEHREYEWGRACILQQEAEICAWWQEEVWRQMLDEEQEKVWTAIDEEAEQAEPAKQRALFRQGKLAVIDLLHCSG